MAQRFLSTAVVLLASLNLVLAHAHHDEISEEQANAPIDAILWIHMFLQAAVWGILFPIGMVLGLAKSRWHVPLQVRDFEPAQSSSFHCEAEHRFRLDVRWVHPRPLSCWTRLPIICARPFLQLFTIACLASIGPRHLSEASHT